MWIYFDVLKDSDNAWFQCSIHLLKMVAKISPRLLYHLAKIYFNYSIHLSILMTFLMTKKRYRSWHRKPLFRYLSRKVQSNLEYSNYLTIHYKTGGILRKLFYNSIFNVKMIRRKNNNTICNLLISAHYITIYLIRQYNHIRSFSLQFTTRIIWA